MVLSNTTLDSVPRFQFAWDNATKDVITKNIQRSVRSTIMEKRKVDGYDTVPKGYRGGAWVYLKIVFDNYIIASNQFIILNEVNTILFRHFKSIIKLEFLYSIIKIKFIKLIIINYIDYSINFLEIKDDSYVFSAWIEPAWYLWWL